MYVSPPAGSPIRIVSLTSKWRRMAEGDAAAAVVDICAGVCCSASRSRRSRSCTTGADAAPRRAPPPSSGSRTASRQLPKPSAAALSREPRRPDVVAGTGRRQESEVRPEAATAVLAALALAPKGTAAAAGEHAHRVLSARWRPRALRKERQVVFARRSPRTTRCPRAPFARAAAAAGRRGGGGATHARAALELRPFDPERRPAPTARGGARRRPRGARRRRRAADDPAATAAFAVPEAAAWVPPEAPAALALTGPAPGGGGAAPAEELLINPLEEGCFHDGIWMAGANKQRQEYHSCGQFNNVLASLLHGLRLARAVPHARATWLLRALRRAADACRI